MLVQMAYMALRYAPFLLDVILLGSCYHVQNSVPVWHISSFAERESMDVQMLLRYWL